MPATQPGTQPTIAFEPKCPGAGRRRHAAPGGGKLINIRWMDGEMQAVVAAIEAGTAPQLDPGVVEVIRQATPPHHGATWTISLEFVDGQRLKGGATRGASARSSASPTRRGPASSRG